MKDKLTDVLAWGILYILAGIAIAIFLFVFEMIERAFPLYG